ncbi:MAG: protein phosphatase 2C domain-containing protein [Actinomycetota bacterium]|nr:protein phosphatase 2C domain-containing protein [Actinomycetota bacterium]
MLRISGVGASHVGLVREHNEDAGFVSPMLILVADGVGGAAAGEVASATTAYVVAATALARPDHDPAEVLTAAVARAFEQLVLGVAEDPRRSGMATTLTALLTDGARFALAHIGDSRGYLYRANELTRITHDHTVVQGLVDEGQLDEQAAESSAFRNVLTRTIHAGREPADVVPLDLVDGDRVLLASDGLTDLVSDRRIEEILRGYDDDEALPRLVDEALGEGGRDNVTCVLGTIIEGPPVSSDGALLGTVREVSNIVNAAAVRRDASA